MSINSIIKKMKPRMRESVADLIDGRYTPKEIAFREGVTVQAVYMRRRAFEKAAKKQLPRHEKRGRKPKPLAIAA